MDSSSNHSSNTSSGLPSPTSDVQQGRTFYTQTANSIIAVIALLGNTLVILLLVVNRKTLLKKSYNMLILSLAISDVLTAFLLITNPALVLGDSFPYPTNHIVGDIFCRVIWSRVFLFQLVVFSAYICLALATERWYAVIKPHIYKEIFNQKRTLVYIFLVWLWSLSLCCTSFFDTGYVPSNPPSRRCKWQLYWSEQPVRGIVGVIQVLFKMALPSLTMLFLFIHMVYKTRKSTIASAESRAKMRGKVTRMVGAASVMLIICFAPSQTNYALAMAGKTRLGTNLHHVLSILVFVNSCLNPFIYGLSNKNYRFGFWKILLSVCSRSIRDGRNTVSASETSTKQQNAKFPRPGLPSLIGARSAWSR